MFMWLGAAYYYCVSWCLCGQTKVASPLYYATICCILVSHPLPHSFLGSTSLAILLISCSVCIDAADLHVDLLLSVLQNS